MKQILLLCFFLVISTHLYAEPFRAGAAKVDISPTELPAIVNGMFTARSGTTVHDPLRSRALILDDGKMKIAFVVVDSLMLPRDLIDEVKTEASKKTEIPVANMLVSATHTHSAPSAMGALGTDVDEKYRAFLIPRLVESIVEANLQLQGAQIGWTTFQDYEHNHCRRWIRRSDGRDWTGGRDPFGRDTVVANMHPGYQSAKHIGPSGPVDAAFTMVAVRSLAGKPIAVLGNYANHYFGGAYISAGASGKFGPVLAKVLEADDAFVGLLSQGTSGDSMWMNYAKPKVNPTVDEYTQALADNAAAAWKALEFQDSLPLGMKEVELTLKRRAPDPERLAWAKQVMDSVGDRPVKSRPEIYAREQLMIAEDPEADLKLQAIQIGDLGVTGIPNEVYGITGLKIRAANPLAHTMNIELANGAEGYIPPLEQHHLGGYTTWEARTAGLEREAEPQIIEALVGAFEQLTGEKRVDREVPDDHYVRTVLTSKPSAFWRLDEMSGQIARDASGNGRDAAYEPGISFFVPGRNLENLEHVEATVNRGVACAVGGRIVAPKLSATTIEFWFWNGFPAEARAIQGNIVGIGDVGIAIAGNRLKIGEQVGAGEIGFRTWHHFAISGDTVFLDGKPDLKMEIPRGNLVFGGQANGELGLEGKLDDIAVYDRVLRAGEILTHFESAGKVARESDPLSPEDSIAQTHVRDGYKLELVVAEPLVIDPVAFDWSADGRLWVVEMHDYPSGVDGDGKAGGRVRVLEDSDGDGKYNQSRVFLDGLNFPTGIKTWRDGALITAAPEIIFARDADGDGVADEKKVLFSGFSQGNQQLRVNGLRWGLDNWIHCASGAHHGGYQKGTEVVSTLTGVKTSLGSRDFRIRPDTGELDPQSGPSQFGRNRDDWGNWFGVQNSMPLWHYVLEDQDLRRNPYFGGPNPKSQVLPKSPPVYPAKSPQKRFHGFDQSGKFTSACSSIIYRDELLFPRSDEQHSFSCEPFHNLVQHNIISRDGVTFEARRDAAEEGIDFIASKDRWFRPVMVRTGPDGALWVADMYRYMIEHPQWLPQNGKDELRPYFRDGSDKGRIYRVVPEDGTARDWEIGEDLLKLLAHPNGWVRDTAQQLLIQGDDGRELKEMVRDHENPLARLHALCTLDGVGELDAETVAVAREDGHPEVRRHAVRLSDPAALVGMRDDAPEVQLQLALSLEDGPELARAAAYGNEWISGAAMSSLNADNLILALESVTGNAGVFAEILGQAEGWKKSKEATEVLVRALPDMNANAQMLAVQSWNSALKPKTIPPAINEVLKLAEKVAFDSAAELGLRLSAIALLGPDESTLKLLSAKEPLEIQKAAVAQISNPDWLLENWADRGPALRAEILTRLLSRKTWASKLLDAVESGAVARGDIDPSSRHKIAAIDPNLKARAQQLLKIAPDRAKVLEEFRPALELAGNAKNGRVIFEQRCATCHELGGIGKAIGPDLTAITNKTGEALLEAVVDPNAMVEARYGLYAATTRDDETFAGMVASETGTQVVLLGADGQRFELLRGEITELKSMGVSLMPPGLEAELSAQEFADLIKFVQQPK